MCQVDVTPVPLADCMCSTTNLLNTGAFLLINSVNFLESLVSLPIKLLIDFVSSVSNLLLKVFALIFCVSFCVLLRFFSFKRTFSVFCSALLATFSEFTINSLGNPRDSDVVSILSASAKLVSSEAICIDSGESIVIAP